MARYSFRTIETAKPPTGQRDSRVSERSALGVGTKKRSECLTLTTKTETEETTASKISKFFVFGAMR